MTEFKPTNQLRFVKRNMQSGNLGWTEKVLQQLWVKYEYKLDEDSYSSEVCHKYWRDVELVDETGAAVEDENERG